MLTFYQNILKIQDWRFSNAVRLLYKFCYIASGFLFISALVSTFFIFSPIRAFATIFLMLYTKHLSNIANKNRRSFTALWRYCIISTIYLFILGPGLLNYVSTFAQTSLGQGFLTTLIAACKFEKATFLFHTCQIQNLNIYLNGIVYICRGFEVVVKSALLATLALPAAIKPLCSSNMLGSEPELSTAPRTGACDEFIRRFFYNI